jgi:alkylated DNA repair dioxygenase AlkB
MAAISNSRDFQYHENFLDPGYAWGLLSSLYAELRWQQYPIRLFGRTVLQPRLSSWYGDPGATYAYSGLSLLPLPWHPQLASLRELLQESLGQPFNSVLANAYRHGSDSMGWHADDEKELGANPLIASLSLGATRRFLVKARTGIGSREWLLHNGSLLVMRGNSQSAYLHALPKTRKPVGLRINLTFRQVYSADR